MLINVLCVVVKEEAVEKWGAKKEKGATFVGWSNDRPVCL